MSGNIEGGKKAATTNKARHGSDFYAKIGKTGGKAKVTKGFGSNPELARSAGTKGGYKSSRKGIKNGEGKSFIKPSLWDRMKHSFNA